MFNKKVSNLLGHAKKTSRPNDITKHYYYYEKYDDFINHRNIPTKNILEIGTFEGDSAKIISKAFPNSNIVTLDSEIKSIDFSNYKNVNYLQVDQTNKEQLQAIIVDHFPKGIDIVFDDASHVGYFSKITFDIVFPFVNSGGAYFIEDWGTGYWDDWVDGSRLQEFPVTPHINHWIPKRIPSHDFGMVGFVKSLVDLTHETAIKNNQNDEHTQESSISVLEFGEGVAMIKKSKKSTSLKSE